MKLLSGSAWTWALQWRLESVGGDFRGRRAPSIVGRLSRTGVPRNALVLSAVGLAIAAYVSSQSDSDAYLALFGISVFGSLVVWILIFVTHMRFRAVRARLGLPDSAARLFGAPVTTVVASIFLAGVLVSTPFIEGLDTAWMFGLPFFAVVLVAFAIVQRRGVDRAEFDPLAQEIAARGVPRS